MTDDLVKRLRAEYEAGWDTGCCTAAADRIEAMTAEKIWAKHEREHLFDRIEALTAENERLRVGLHEVFEQWAGSEGFIPETAPEGYLLQLTKRMADIARAALTGDGK